MITLMWVALGIFAFLAAAAIIAGVWAVLREKYGDAGLTVNAATVADIDMTMPPEIAHDEYPRVAVLRDELTAELASAFLSAPLAAEPQSSPAPTPPPPREAQEPGTTAAAAAKTPVRPPPLPRLLPPAAAAIGALRVLTAPHRAAQARAWHAEVMSVFPPDRPWPSDDTLTRMTAIKGDL